MSDPDRLCCPPPPHPRLPDIRAGLSSLPRQLTGFPDYRRAMLAAIPDKEALTGWRADGAHDLGVMLIEAWAYVLDITGFYDKIVAERAYLGTALDDKVMREIVALLGYVPRPAMAARVLLALEADGRDKVTAPVATAFRSQAFDAEPPQVFELAAAAEIWPQRNKWTLAPYRLTSFDGTLRFLPGEGPGVGAVIALRTGSAPFVGRVASVETASEADGLKYQLARFESGSPSAFVGSALSSLKAETLTMKAGLSPLVGRSTALTTTGTTGEAILDSLYPQLGRYAAAAIEVDGVLRAAWITNVTLHTQSVSVGSGGATANVQLTKIAFNVSGTIGDSASVLFHLAPRPLGRPTRPAETERSLASMLPAAPLEKPVEPLGAAPSAGSSIAAGAKAAGALVPGTIAFGPEGAASFQPDAAASAFAEPLVAPVRLYGNVVEAVRGETVGEEVIGSGDASQPRQRFTLRKKPLTWIEDASQGLGRAPQLTVRIDGLAWTYVESFYGRGPDERVYRVEMDEDGAATVVLGDGVTGARATSGVNNVVASYRWGAGAAKPPAGSFKQFARPAKGLARVAGPLAAYGGADAEGADELRRAAPAGMLSLGRAVSVADFEAMVRSYSGIANAAVAYSWDAVRHEATVLAWIISDAGDLSAPLADFLSARAMPGLSIRVANAVAIEVPVFDITIEAAEGYAADAVREAVRIALFDPSEGRLSPGRIAISAPLFRSRLIAWIHAVPGVKSVKSIMVESGEMPKAMVLADGQWFDLVSNGQVL